MVIPADEDAALIAAYTGLNVPADEGVEQIGTMALEGNGLRKITGSNRLTAALADELLAAGVPGLAVVDEWPADWVWPEAGGG